VSELVPHGLLLTGCAFLLLAAVGIVRMPDLFTRMQTATKGGTLGISCILIAVAVSMEDLGLAVRALLTVAFFFLTAPVAAHMIGRAAYFVGVPLWHRTIADELKGHYDRRTHVLSAALAPDAAEAPREPEAR